MATTRIPAIYGELPSRYVTKHSPTSTSEDENVQKNENFIRYYIEAEDSVITDSEDSTITDSEDDNTSNQDDNGNLIADRRQNYQHDSCVHIYYGKLCSRFRTRRKTKTFNKKNLTKCSYNLADYIAHRGLGLSRFHTQSIDRDFGLHQMINENLFKENKIPLDNVDKVFCSQWLTDNQILVGTKCNKLLVYDINTRKKFIIPCLKGLHANNYPYKQCGIHAIKFSPSRNLMATGARNSSDLAIYKLPTLDPVCMGEDGHTDIIFDICWLDNETIVTGSRDGFLGLWKIQDNVIPDKNSVSYNFIKPIYRKKCNGADKVRSMIYNENYGEIVALSLNAKLHIWDANIMRQKISQKLDMSQENVCLAVNENYTMYAVGSKAQATLLDPRTLQSVSKIDTYQKSPQIRSITFGKNILTMGTGNGNILFYDIAAGRYFFPLMKSELQCSKCEILPNERMSDDLDFASPSTQSIKPAIYTHAYDWSGTRLFTAGGPLSISFKGSYAALWC